MNVWEIHPALVHFPIALLLSAIAVDVFAWWRPTDLLNRVATGLLIAGIAAGWLAANFGLLAFYTVPAHTHEAHHLMFWHIGAAVSTLVLFTWLAIVRWFHRAEPITRTRRIVGLLAAALLMTTGGLGGHIVYHGGAGVEPELLAESVRESHSHGGHDRVASRDEQHDGHGRERRQSYYTAPSNQDDHPPEHEHSGKHEMQNHHGAAKSQEKKTETGHADHEQKRDTDSSSKREAPHKETQHKERSATKDHEHEQPAETEEPSEHEHPDKPASDKHDDHAHGHAEKHTSDESKKPTAGHQHAGTRPKEVSRPKDPPLGPDFERNVQENRQRNIPKTGEHSMKEHGQDAESGKDESGMKHQH